MPGVQYLISGHTVTPDCAVHGCTHTWFVGVASATQRGVNYMTYFTCGYGKSTIKAISFDGHRCGELRLLATVYSSPYVWFCGRGYGVSISLFDPLWAGQWASGIS